MNNFVRGLITEWRRLELPVEAETIIVAVSGGADSLSLLLALDELRGLKKLDLRLVAAHFNHKLRGRESEADEEFVRHVAAERRIELALGHGPIGPDGNLEQNARNARYAFLAETARGLRARYVCTAHTVNDQAETFLLNLIRGSGADGLAGMKVIRELGSVAVEAKGSERVSPSLPFSPTPLLARPLLSWARREDTENYCRSTGIEFRYDTMNEDMSFKRVRVRKMLLPMLKEFNPKIIETLAQTAELMREYAGSGQFPSDAEQNGDPGKLPETLSVEELKGLEKAELRSAVRSWLELRRGGLRSLGLKHIEAIERLVASTKSGRVIELPGFGIVRKHGGRLSFENIKVDK